MVELQPMPENVQVEVAYATPQVQIVIDLTLAAGATVADALAAANLDPRFSSVDISVDGNEVAVGVFGRVCERSQSLASGDRVEIYRELTVDPKTARRQRAQRQKAK
jgi:putative ubiquitin-RnfH superfamily antitoxin RatB of RatAB toxin-antitoxin module